MSLYGTNLFDDECGQSLARSKAAVFRTYADHSSARHSSCIDEAEAASDCEQAGRLFVSIKNIAAGVVIVQTIEHGLTVVADNLLKMRSLTANLLNHELDQEQQAQIKAEFDQLAEQNQHIAHAATCDGVPLHGDEQRIDIFADDQAVVVWSTRRLPEIHTDLKTCPENVYDSIESALSNISDSLDAIRQTSSKLLRYCDTLHRQSESVMKQENPVRTASSAKKTAYRTATHILQTDQTATQCHSESIRHVASSIFG